MLSHSLIFHYFPISPFNDKAATGYVAPKTPNVERTVPENALNPRTGRSQPLTSQIATLPP